MESPKIVLRKVKVHNLKSVDLTLDHNQLIVFTGVSGSGKSSLAFDTIYVEGQRRYVESLSTYARRHLGDLPKPDAELISGISPTIAIEQKTAGRNPRSTVGTMTGIYDFLRILYARIGIAHCPVSGEVVTPQSLEHILRAIKKIPEGSKLLLLAPYAKKKKGEFKEDFAELMRKGFTRVRLDGQLRDLSEDISVDGRVAHDVDIVVDRLVLRPGEENRLAEGISTALDCGQGVMSIAFGEEGEEKLFSQHAYSPKSGLSYGSLDPTDFSFNHPSGMCPTCQGLGRIQEFDLERIIDPNLCIAEDCCSIASSYQTVRYKNIYDNLARLYKFDVRTPWKKLSDTAKHVFLYGTEKKWTAMQFIHPTKKSRWSEYVQWRGILYEAKERFNQAQSEVYRSKKRQLMRESLCPDCRGEKIKPYPAATTLNGKRIAQITAMAIDESLHFFETLSLTQQEQIIGSEAVKEIRERLHFLKGVGLEYLTLDRTAPTLSGGEAQRVRLASQIGSGLVGATYVLDEPSIGLHPRDNAKLLLTLKHLRDKGNTVIVVEHDEETIRAADTLVDVGPLAGQNGGRILVQGNFNDLIASKESLTGAYLSGRLEIPIPKQRRSARKKLLIEKASHHNLKKIDVAIPLGVFTAVTGVSGSGKSSLIIDTLYPALANKLHNAALPVGAHKKIAHVEEIDKVIAIDQMPIGKTPRSNPSTFIKLFDDIRALFSALPHSLAQGYKAGRFSFNVKEGSCPHCLGMGMLKIDMDFMEDEWVFCPHCEGKRFDDNTLSILYRGKNIFDILEMTVAECLVFFSDIPHVKAKLDTLMRVGMDYIKIGQPSPTLSGGEAQRIKLAKELTRPSTGNTLYILDEPTTGLHFHDIKKLIDVLQELVNKGNSILVIEHNMNIIKTADWIIDLGPEGGRNGGELVAEGTPEKIASLKTPTAVALKQALKPPKGKKEIAHSASGAQLTEICVLGAMQNNLKKVDASIPRGKITLCTGPSGSGKSSFAFETIYAEGQRRYIESLSPYARQFVKQMPKPKLEHIEGLSPAIAIEQKSHAGNPRSTIGTMTEAYDYLRLLFAHLGVPHCPETGEEIQSITPGYVQERLLALPAKTKLYILSPLALKRSEAFEDLKERWQREGYLRIRLNGVYFELDEPIPFEKQRKNALFLVIDRLLVSGENAKRLYDAIDQAARLSGGTLVAATDEKDFFFNLSFAVPSTGKSYLPITPHTFSFNTEQGMCLDCQGLGVQYGADLSRHSQIMQLSAYDLILLLWKDLCTKETLKIFRLCLKKAEIDPDIPLHRLSDEKIQFLFHDKQQGLISHKDLELQWRGLNVAFALLAKCSDPELKAALLPILEANTCRSCQGTRLNPLARHVTIDGLSIADVCRLSIDQALVFCEKIILKKADHNFLDEPLRQLKHRLVFLKKVGLEYLSLERSAPTLSGGEAQRIRLARQLGSGLTGCLYVLDEPTIGLHPYDNERLNNALTHLCALGNTLLLVEHDPLTIEKADYILDFGPHAGNQGGKITARGTLAQIKKNPDSLTGAYLSGLKKIPLPSKRKKSSAFLRIRNAKLHNLKDLNADIPLGTLTCVSGVSGSGKSTLINDILRPALEKALGKEKRNQCQYLGAQISGWDSLDTLLVLDQNPIGHTQRADISTYVDLLTPLRYLFASLPEAQVRALLPKHFSYNHKKGMCTTCWGLGTRSIPMQFLPPVKVTCESCHGFRLNPLSLKVTYKGKHLGHILQMNVEQALDFLPPIPKVVRILETLISVGLGYVQLGQEIATLSGGEAQRLRLVRELAKRSKGHTLYLFDEPTVGLHTDDIAKLLKIFESLIQKGHTVLIIEHNLDILSCADHIIDMGPGSGERGGAIVATGSPEEIVQNPASLTGKYLKEHLLFLRKN
ncbi:MAG TPA: excinuclease ABC subunit UvrA [Rhabdochlamydiaceae bacterium]|jgi:excinuclease ABC subunit A